MKTLIASIAILFFIGCAGDKKKPENKSEKSVGTAKTKVPPAAPTDKAAPAAGTEKAPPAVVKTPAPPVVKAPAVPVVKAPAVPVVKAVTAPTPPGVKVPTAPAVKLAAPPAPTGPTSPALGEGKKLIDETAVAMGKFVGELKGAGGDKAKIDALKKKFSADNAALKKRGEAIKGKLTPADQKALQAYAKQKLAPIMQQMFAVMMAAKGGLKAPGVKPGAIKIGPKPATPPPAPSPKAVTPPKAAAPPAPAAKPKTAAPPAPAPAPAK